MDPLLYRAATSGELGFLETLTADEETRYFSQLTPKNNTVFHEFKQVEFLKKACLKSSPLLIWQPNLKGETVLHVAARVGCTEIVLFLIQQASISPFIDEQGRQHNVIRKKNKAGDTALNCAIRSGRYHVVQCLLRTDPELSSFCNYADESPLYLAVSSYFTSIAFEIIRLSLNSYSHSGPKGLNPLHDAVTHKSGSKLVEELAKQRPEMIEEADNVLGWTPFHYAAFGGETESVKILLKYDVNSSAAFLLDHDGNSALHFAACFEKINVIKELTERCPDIFELTNKKGQTALHVAVLEGKVEVVKYVLGNQLLAGLLNEQDEDGNTPLHLAILFDQNPIAVLLAKDLRVYTNVTNKEFKTPYDIYLLSFREFGFRSAKIKWLLRGTSSYTRYSQHWVKEVTKGQLNRVSHLQPYSSGLQDYRDQSKRNYEKYPEVFLLVAILVTTISFSAAFTIPGGYKTDGANKGEPILVEKSSFKAFMLYDIISFLSSLSAIFFHGCAARGDYDVRARYETIQHFSLNLGVLALAMTFAAGVHVMLDNSSPGLAKAPYVLVLFLFYIYYVCSALDPFGGNVSIDKTWAIGKYRFRVKCGSPAGRIFPTFTYYIHGQRKHR